MSSPAVMKPVVAIVPARGGSKRIPRKNIRSFLGKPLLERTLETVLEASLFERVVVSTDDDEIAAVSLASGAEVPFRRPASLADDHTGARPVINHAIRALEEISGARLGAVCVVYPTAVFVRPEDLSVAFERLERESADFVFSAVSYDAPIRRALRERPDGYCEPVWPEHVHTRSQDLEEVYHDAGQFYWGHRDAWLEGTAVFAARSFLHVLPRWRVQDIDTEEDWARAEMIYRVIHGDQE